MLLPCDTLPLVFQNGTSSLLDIFVLQSLMSGLFYQRIPWLPLLIQPPPTLPAGAPASHQRAACVHPDPGAQRPQAEGVEVTGESPGVKTLCAQFRDPNLTVRPRDRQGTVPPQARLSFPRATGLYCSAAVAGLKGGQRATF